MASFGHQNIRNSLNIDVKNNNLYISKDQQSSSLAETSQCDQLNKVIDKSWEQSDTQNLHEEILMDYDQFQKQHSAQSKNDQIKHKFNQKNIIEHAKIQKNMLDENIQKLMKELSLLEDQTYDPSKKKYRFNPNQLTSQCIEKMEQLNTLIEHNLFTQNQVNGSQYVIQFPCDDEIRYIQQVQNLQSKWFELKDYYVLDYTNYDPTDLYYIHQQINAFEQSQNGKLLACCQYNKIFIWNLINNEIIKEIEHHGFIQSIAFYEDSNHIVVGDDKGSIAKFDSLSKQLDPFLSMNIHESTISQIIIKNNDLLYSCSTDNKIKLTDLLNSKILLVIENIFSCLSGFEYSSNGNFLIAPNDQKQLIMWDGITGQELTNVNFQIKETEFISIYLSSKQDKILVNLFGQRKIILLEIQTQNNLKSLILIKQMNMEAKCYSLSWCLNDNAIIYLLLGVLRLRFLGQMNIPIIQETSIRDNFQFTQKPFTNKYSQELKDMMIPLGRFVYIYNFIEETSHK